MDRIRLLGGSFDIVTRAEVLVFVAGRIARREKAIIGNLNQHGLCLLRKHPEMRAFCERADIMQIDSTPLIWWGRLLGHKLSSQNRSTYLDWREEFWALAVERGWRVFYFGGQPGVAKIAAAEIRKRHPRAELQVEHGYHSREAMTDVIAKINAYQPDAIFVGLGMPLQEQWILEHIDHLESGVLFSVGAAFDYEAGIVRTAPRWLGWLGLEWAFRLAMEPTRLFHRYVVEPWSLIGAALVDIGTAIMRRRGAGEAHE